MKKISFTAAHRNTEGKKQQKSDSGFHWGGGMVNLIVLWLSTFPCSHEINQLQRTAAHLETETKKTPHDVCTNALVFCWFLDKIVYCS